MQFQLTKYFAVGLLAITLTGTALVGESSAQWGRFAMPYYVNYNVNSYHAYPAYPTYPAYIAWRPFGGLFAGIHTGLQRVLCPGCWHSPCCCVTPMICDPCFDPCLNSCCDPCYDPCCSFVGGVGYSGQWGYYERPASLSVGVPSPSGFGSITPSEGVPGQRPVGVPSVQRPAIPSTGRTVTTSPDPYMQGVPSYTGQPNLAPPQNQVAYPDPASKIDTQLNEMPRPEPFVADPNRFHNNAADIPPTTGTEPWYNDTATPGDSTPPGGMIPPPAGTQPQGSTVQPGPGSSTTNLMNLGTGTISVTVPDNAKVFINGYETKMPGINRKYVVNDLEPGKLYDYEVHIVAQVNGRTVEETQYVTLTYGQQGVLAFGKPQSQPQSDNVRYIAARPVH